MRLEQMAVVIEAGEVVVNIQEDMAEWPPGESEPKPKLDCLLYWRISLNVPDAEFLK